MFCRECHKIDAVSPNEETDSEEEGEDIVEGTVGERIKGEKDEERVRQVTDPRENNTSRKRIGEALSGPFAV
jgi:hypothetical protein